MQRKCLIYLHIPRTGGSTLNRIISRQAPRETVFSGYPYPYSAFIESLATKKEGEIQYITGHVLFGLHNRLSYPSAYITMLRHPVDRVISWYYYVVSNPRHHLHGKAVSLSLEACMHRKVSRELSNDQTRLISGFNEPASDKSLEAAKVNLRDSFLAFGLTEKFDESLILFKELLGWKNIFYTKDSVVRNRPLMHEVPKETIRLIEDYNKIDLELYEFAEKVFKRMLYEKNLPLRRVFVFKTLNSVNKPFHKFRRKFEERLKIRNQPNR